jgi:hypothetical protein
MVSRPSPGAGAIVLRGADAQASPCIVLSRNGIRSDERPTSKLVFHRYGDTYFLTQVWAAGYSSGWEFPASKLEREMAARLSAPSNTSVTALPR